MQDRLLIQKYELVLGKGKKKTKDGVESIEKGKRPPRSARRKKPKPPPMHKEPELTPEEKADIEGAFKNAREANEAYEKNRKKLPLAQTSDFRQMEELKRGGMSGEHDHIHTEESDQNQQAFQARRARVRVVRQTGEIMKTTSPHC